MKLLGIDYGQKKVGLALSDGIIAEPLKVIRFKEEKILIKKIEEVVQTEEVKLIVIGISEGKMGEETKKFVKSLRENIQTQILFQDETLSTQTAQTLSINADLKRKKRREMEDAYSAAVILQTYLDSLS